MTTTTRPRCTSTLNSHGRHWRCARPAAAKYGHRFCGYCVSLMPKRCRADHHGGTYHRYACTYADGTCDLATPPAILIGGIRNGMQWATCTHHGPFAVPSGSNEVIACATCPRDIPALLDGVR